MTVSSSTLSQAIIQGMQEKKAHNIVAMDLRKIDNAMADFIVICSGGSDKQLSAIVNSIDQFVFRSLRETPWHIEGKTSRAWMLLDYVTVVAHVFQDEQRALYQLESLWGDACMV